MPSSSKPVVVRIRISEDDRVLIDRAAQSCGMTTTAFVRNAALSKASDMLLDRTVFNVSAEQYAEFLARLDAPPRTNERLRRTMRARPDDWAFCEEAARQGRKLRGRPEEAEALDFIEAVFAWPKP